LLLALSVISRQAQSLGPSQFRIFDQRGGTIGRSKQADWCLDDPDQVLSNRHAAVHCVDGRFLIEDTSTNGTALNRADALLPRQQPMPLNDGDHLFLGDFEILVQVIAEAAAPEPVAPMPPAYGGPAPYPQATPPLSMYGEPDVPSMAAPGRSLDWPQDPPQPVWPLPTDYSALPPAAPALGPAPSDGGGLADLMRSDSGAGGYAPPPPAWPPVAEPPAAPSPWPPAADPAPSPWPAAADPAPSPWPPAMDAAPPVHAGYPPAAEPAGYPPPAAMPMTPPPAAAYAPPPVAPPPQAYAAPAAAGSVDLDALFQSIGLDPQQVLPETANQIGTILRIVTQGLVDVLRARAAVKNQFRMNATFIRPVENNPLKFARDPDDALHTLFVKRNPGYLGPVESYREAFDDLGRHQLAMLAGMQAAFTAVLQRFNPQSVESACDKAMQGRALLLAGVIKPLS
jgi:type VI secretion system FHA domain protein